MIRNECSGKCTICQNYMAELGTCKFCHFEYDESYNPFSKDDWDIFNLNDDDGWSHHQIRDRLFLKGVECLFVDIWCNDDIAWIIGARANSDKVADVLNIHTDVIYDDPEHGFMILNLFQEKYLRGMLDAGE